MSHACCGLLKSLKFGNCAVTAAIERPSITLADIREAFQNDLQGKNRLDCLKRSLDVLIEEASWESEYFFEHDHKSAEVEDCIIYYTTGYVCRKVGNKTARKLCRDGLITQEEFRDLPEADLVSYQAQGKLIHLNTNVFYLLKATGKEFAKQPSDNSAYRKKLDHVLLTYHFPFPSPMH